MIAAEPSKISVSFVKSSVYFRTELELFGVLIGQLTFGPRSDSPTKMTPFNEEELVLEKRENARCRNRIDVIIESG